MFYCFGNIKVPLLIFEIKSLGSIYSIICIKFIDCSI